MARYERGHKAETRQRIVESAAARLRKDGIDGVGVATLMRDAGLTIGGFYAHFESKEDLVRDAVVHALKSMPDGFGIETSGTSFDLAAFVEKYLSPWHRDHPWEGCPIAALLPELSRRPAAKREPVVEQGRATIDMIAAGLPEPVAGPERFMRALEVMSHMLGTLQMARFVTDEALSDEILARGRTAALRLAGIEPQSRDAG